MSIRGMRLRMRRRGRRLAPETSRRVTSIAGVLLGALLLAAAGFLVWSPVPLSTWVSEPRDALWLALGENPHPVKLMVPADPTLSAVALLGARLFHDPTLSGSGRLSCASCHDPALAYGPTGSLPVVMGGPHVSTPGFRAVPSLRYLYRQPAFTIGPDIESGNDVVVPLAQQAQPRATPAR